jgi:hypothetical protein
MDFLKFNPQYSVLICARCRYALQPKAIRAHLKAKHGNELSDPDIKAYVKACSAYDIALPAVTQRRVVLSNTPPIPHLKTSPDGIRCQLCETDTPYIYCSDDWMKGHLKNVHSWEWSDKKTPFSKVAASPIHCQTFYFSKFLCFFEVASPPKAPAPTPAAVLRALVLKGSVNATLNSATSETIKRQLAQKLLDIQDAAAAISRAEISPEVSPWLEKTQWPDYFKGRELSKAVVGLIDLPDSSTTAAQQERCLSGILAAFDHLIEQSRQAIRERKINVFD